MYIRCKTNSKGILLANIMVTAIFLCWACFAMSASVHPNVSQTSQEESTSTAVEENSGQFNIKFDVDQDSEKMSYKVMMVAIVALVLSLGMPIIIVFLSLYFASKKRAQKAELIEKILASGQPLPDALVEDASGNSRDNSVEGAIKTIAVGLGLLFFLTALIGFEIGAVGFILIFIGAARLLTFWWREKNRSGSRDKP